MNCLKSQLHQEVQFFVSGWAVEEASSLLMFAKGIHTSDRVPCFKAILMSPPEPGFFDVVLPKNTKALQVSGQRMRLVFSQRSLCNSCFSFLLQMASSSILWARKWLCLETTVKPRCKLTWERVARIAFIPLFQDFGGDQSRDYVRLGPWGSCVRRSSRQTGVFGLSEDGAHLCGPGIAASFLPRDIKEEKEIK